MQSTLLEDIETKPESAFPSSYRQFLDEKNPNASKAAIDFYKMVDGPIGDKFKNRLSDCRSRAWFLRNDETGDVRVAAKQCRLRWCYHCAEAKQQFITNAILPWYEKAWLPKLMTLTIKHSDAPLPEQIDFLYKCFAKLRNRKFIKDKIRGGVWFFQVTYNEKTEQWHPHIHALLDAKYIDHDRLMSLWFKITKTSQVVHIRAVQCPEKTLAHNARYAARPSALLSVPRDLWMEMYDAFDGRRICGTWGTAREISLRPQKPDDAEKWQSIGGFKTVVNMIGVLDAANQIWEAWTKNLKLPPGVNLDDTERLIAGSYYEPMPPPRWEVEPYLAGTGFEC